MPGTMSSIATANTGNPSAVPIQKRRVMSTSSGLGASSTDTATGSNAMPQMGHVSGRSLTHSGCIGQVDRAAVAMGETAFSSWSEQQEGAAGAEFRYCPGLAWNFRRHDSLQK